MQQTSLIIHMKQRKKLRKYLQSTTFSYSSVLKPATWDSFHCAPAINNALHADLSVLNYFVLSDIIYHWP